jgi:hypothetical protein
MKRLYDRFLLLDRLGVHVLPKHYYSSIPDHAWLSAHPELWQAPTPLHGIHWSLDEQLGWLDRVCRPYYHEVAGVAEYRRLAEGGHGPGYGPIESQVLHCFVRSERPGRVVEVGGGVTSAVIARASELNVADGGSASRLTTIEPFPADALRKLAGVDLIEDYCQAVPAAVFDRLGAGDLLFIDSTHAVKAGSEVLRLYLEIVPSLAKGVFVHIHDINLPYLYQRDVVTSFIDWQETTLVAALLTENQRLRVLCCQSALHYERPGELGAILRDYRPQANEAGLSAEEAGHFPSSLWLVTS